MLRIVQDLLPLFGVPVRPFGGGVAEKSAEPDAGGWPARLGVGRHLVDGVPVEVVRKRCRRVGIRIESDGCVKLTVPAGQATLAEATDFLRSKWSWVLKTRTKVLSHPEPARSPVTEEDRRRLEALLAELNGLWGRRVGEAGVTWRIRRVKSVWGCCHWNARYITYNEALAHAPRELVEYVVVHEYTHFAVHGHGPRFYALMDARLPGWKKLRSRLNRLEWASTAG